MQTHATTVEFITLDEALASKTFEEAVTDLITLSPCSYEKLADEEKNLLLGTTIEILKHDITDGLDYPDLDRMAKSISQYLLFSSKMAQVDLMDCYVHALKRSYEPAIKEAFNDIYYNYKARGLLDTAEEQRAWEIQQFHNR